MVTKQQIKEALQSVNDPELQKSIIDLHMVKDIHIDDGNVSLTLALTTLQCPMKDKIVGDVKNAIRKVPGVTDIQVKLTAMSKEELDRLFPKHLLVGINKVKHCIAVASGKGGVGKTTIAINLASALSEEGFKVGLLDADIFGPSIPVMMSLCQRPGDEAGMIVPLEKYGLTIMSIGFFIDESQPIIWRGPMVSRAITQFLDEVMWGNLDFLVVDLPPGTGDPSITIAQSIPDASVVIVTTPQEVVLSDAKKAVNMFKSLDTTILGVVENMSYFKCAHSDEKIEIFGSGGGESLRLQMGIPLLGAIPLDIAIRLGGDKGIPFMVDFSDSETGKVFTEIARKIVDSLKISNKVHEK